MKQKWTIQTDGGEVLHSTILMDCRIEIRNYPGTRSIDCVIFNRAGAEWNRILCDKLEVSVRQLKMEAIEWVENKTKNLSKIP